MRDIERLLIALAIAGSPVLGWRHEPLWLLLLALGFAAYVVVAHRALMRRVGPRAWPSEGYARFALNTNLYFSLKYLFAGGVLFVLGDLLAHRLGY